MSKTVKSCYHKVERLEILLFVIIHSSSVLLYFRCITSPFTYKACCLILLYFIFLTVTVEHVVSCVLMKCTGDKAIATLLTKLSHLFCFHDSERVNNEL